MAWFEQLETYLRDLYLNSLSHAIDAFKSAFHSFFGEKHQTFRLKMFHNLDLLRLQLERENLLEVNPRTCLEALRTQFKEFLPPKIAVITYGKLQLQLKDVQINPVHVVDDNLSISKNSWIESEFNNALSKSVNETQLQQHESLVTECTTLEANLSMDVKALHADLVVMESKGTEYGKHDTRSSSENYITHAVDADIRPVNDQVPLTEVQLTAQHNVIANEQQHTDQSEPSYDTYLLEKVDSNTTPDSTNMSHRGGEIDPDAEQDQVKSPLLKAEFLKTNDMVEKEVYNELSNRFLQLEKHCILLEISIQQKEESFQSNKPCKNQDSHEFHEFFEINELKAQLQAKNSTINNLMKQIKNVHGKSNEAKTYKELYDSIKKTRTQTKDHNDSLIAQINSKTVENVDLKAQIREKVFANAALKNELRKLNRTNVDTKNSQEEYFGYQMITVVPKADHSYGSNDMAHNHYLEEARKKTQERNRNSKPSVIPSVRLHNTTNGVNSLAKVESPKTRNKSKPIEPKSHTQKPGKQIAIGQRFSLNKSSAMHEKPKTPRSCLRWIPTCRIFKLAGLRWIPTRKLFYSCTSKVDSEPPNGSNDDITNPYECNQTLNVSAGTLNLSAGLVQNSVSLTTYVPPSKRDYEILFQPMFDEYLEPPLVERPWILSVRGGNKYPSLNTLSAVSISSEKNFVTSKSMDADSYLIHLNTDSVAVAALRPVDPAGSPLSITIDQDVPSASTSLTNQEIQFQVTHQGVEEQIHGHQNA
ncbi:hypothetical protein Tco_0511167 [Tanacetum coccineum]